MVHLVGPNGIFPVVPEGFSCLCKCVQVGDRNTPTACHCLCSFTHRDQKQQKPRHRGPQSSDPVSIHTSGYCNWKSGKFFGSEGLAGRLWVCSPRPRFLCIRILTHFQPLVSLHPCWLVVLPNAGDGFKHCNRTVSLPVHFEPLGAHSVSRHSYEPACLLTRRSWNPISYLRVEKHNTAVLPASRRPRGVVT